MSLSDQSLASFRDVVVLADPDCSDFFFVNAPLLLSRLGQEDLPAFIALEGQEATLVSPSLRSRSVSLMSIAFL